MATPFSIKSPYCHFLGDLTRFVLQCRGGDEDRGAGIINFVNFIIYAIFARVTYYVL